jgi:predicted Zn finger-like uncharacterized protein
MLIVCPNCKKRFDIDAALAAESKKLRCSSCRAVFRLMRKEQGAQEPPREVPAGKIKVVVANESAAFCDAVAKILAPEPFEVFICNDGKVALETVERVQPELLFLDVALPTMFGFEVCERVRQNPALSGVKIVLIASIYDKTRYKRSPMSLYGADDYIEKHHIPDQLIPMIYRLAAVNAPMEQPSDSELAAQEQSRTEIREVEVRETSVQQEPSASDPLSWIDERDQRGAVPRPAVGGAAAAGLQPVFDPAQAAQVTQPVPVEPAAALVEAAPVPTVEALPSDRSDKSDQSDKSDAGGHAAAAAPQPPQLSDVEVKAKRLARIIVSDIVLYNQGKVEQGVRDGNLYELLADDIREGERLYRQRVPEQVRETTSFLKDAFEDLIAKKRAELRV